jgi:hypothetical protein
VADSPQLTQFTAVLLESLKKVAPGVTGPIPMEQSVRECLDTIATFGDDVNGLMVSSLGNEQWLHEQ